MGRARSLLLIAAFTLALLAPPVAGHAATPAALAAATVPTYDHVFTIVLENENFAASWSGPDSPYLQGLRARGAFADQYYGISHVSADNYIAMTSGQPATPPFNFDCVSYASCYAAEKAWPDGGRSIADQAEAAGRTWKAYMESMPGPCVHPALTDPADPNQTGYATRHNPFVYYPPIVDDTARCAQHVVPYTDITADLATEASTPSYVFITPDTCHDAHDTPCTAPPAHAGEPGGLKSADAFLSSEVEKILASPAWTTSRSLLIVTFDENGFTDLQGCCAPPAMGGRIGLVALDSANRITPGTVTTTTYDHWSYLRTMEDALGITEHLNMAGLPTTHSMTDLFN
ncbi:MAG: hypothetical protein QOF97_1151 [Acidimicrobiaceae bacterium]